MVISAEPDRFTTGVTVIVREPPEPDTTILPGGTSVVLVDDVVTVKLPTGVS